MESHMYSIYPETVDVLGFAAIGWDMPYEVIHHDNLQSVLGLSGHDGTVLQTTSYDPFGNITSTTGSSNNNQLHFTGREQDPDTLLYNDRIRIYDPITGRFISEDPLGFKAGVNFYVYCNNNGINANDPYGLAEAIFSAGWHLSPNLLPISQGKSYNAAFANGKLEARPTVAEEVLGSWVDAGANMGIGDISGTGNSAGKTYNIGLGKYFGIQVTVQKDFNWRDPSTYLDAVTVGVGVPIPSSPVTITAPLDETTPQSTSSYRDLQLLLAPTPAPKYNYGIPDAGSTSFDLSGFSGSGGSPAAGGYLLYPNKPNTNMMQAVYSKQR